MKSDEVIGEAGEAEKGRPGEGGSGRGIGFGYFNGVCERNREDLLSISSIAMKGMGELMDVLLKNMKKQGSKVQVCILLYP